MSSFEIKDHMIETLDDYHQKSLFMQQYHFEGNPQNFTEADLKEAVDDDLIFNVPIYDMLDRKYASFCSLLEALKKGHKDPKGNGKYFEEPRLGQFEWLMLFYLFRLCGSGINYIPKKDRPFGTHGFGNFWLVDELVYGKYRVAEWFYDLENLKGPFTDNKGYLLPQFSYPNIKTGHLKKFILEESIGLVKHVIDFITKNNRPEIYRVVDSANEYLIAKGFKRQNFVLSAFVIDIAEYHPDLVDPNSTTYAGTNAKKCIRAIFKKTKKVSDFEYETDCIRFLADRYKTTPYSVEDSRNCDVVRYFQEYQSAHHIAKNNGVLYKNNSVLKKKMGIDKYYQFVNELK